ncbi:MAG TPA: hypothetical protein PLB10_12545 [Thiolinea sp.]|nr:hypothetical protein [Thiolinea sp.]
MDGDVDEESFWPSFTDIMMVIVMTFLLVTVAVVLTNTRLLDQLRNSLVAQEEASQLAEFTLKENATLEEQLDYFRRQASALEMELLRARARQEETGRALLEVRNEAGRLRSERDRQQAALEQSREQLEAARQALGRVTEAGSQAQMALTRMQEQLGTETGRLQDELQTARTRLTQVRRELEQENASLQDRLQQAETGLSVARDEAQSREELLGRLQQQHDAGQQRLASLEGEYDELDRKYQRLLKPTRSARGKTVVDVMYSRSGYRIREPGRQNYRNVGRTELEAALQQLKQQYGTDLYVKIIIPQDSGLSYSQAWAFTRDTLNRYDYYYQGDPETAAPDEGTAVPRTEPD